ncbi:MAG: T9SS type A sorting domain-containing protein [Flavobacteriaceae bacterium]|nr:T9SS type A sorting domain-containing protein [Flavobacteriaceae bacterium]
MKKILLITICFCWAIGFSQENWGYLPIELYNQHGSIYPIDENVVQVVTDGGVFYKTENGGENWAQFDSGVNEIFLDLAFDGPNNGYAVGDKGKIIKTANAGQTWTELASNTSEALISVTVNAPNSVWTVGNNGVILHSTDGGNIWILNNILSSERLNSVKFKDENIGYIAGDNGVLFYTENGGADWEQLAIPTTDDLFSISITENYVYILNGTSTYWDDFTYSAEKFYKSNDNINWTEHFTNILSGAIDFAFVNDEKGFEISTEACLCDECYVTVSKTINSGENWENSYDELTNAANCNATFGCGKIKFASEEVIYVLLAGHILKTPYESAGVEGFNKNNAFTIYPNPSTNGKFNLKINSTNTQGLSLEIVDMTGKKIYAENDLKENNTISLPNISEGIYFIKLLKEGNMIASKKLIKG